MITKMCEGNPGALQVLIECLRDSATIDPNGIGRIGPILSMDTLKLYGSRIWMLYADVCRHDLRCMIGVLRAWQLGFISSAEINHAVENYGEGLDVPSLMTKVEERLPEFQRQQIKTTDLSTTPSVTVPEPASPPANEEKM